eukprot:GHRQ01029030.1.p2 GENE.GHRQ01029030.1~~GHRQ01029030.1.p2  ORF type:complete len:127 (+),score=24.83 GHRQ01029030.1:240-620(+)
MASTMLVCPALALYSSGSPQSSKPVQQLHCTSSVQAASCGVFVVMESTACTASCSSSQMACTTETGHEAVSSRREWRTHTDVCPSEGVFSLHGTAAELANHWLANHWYGCCACQPMSWQLADWLTL